MKSVLLGLVPNSIAPSGHRLLTTDQVGLSNEIEPRDIAARQKTRPSFVVEIRESLSFAGGNRLVVRSLPSRNICHPS